MFALDQPLSKYYKSLHNFSEADPFTAVVLGGGNGVSQVDGGNYERQGAKKNLVMLEQNFDV